MRTFETTTADHTVEAEAGERHRIVFTVTSRADRPRTARAVLTR